MLSKEIVEAITHLCDLIKADRSYTAVMEAADKYNNDPDISAAMTEYTVQQQALTAAYTNEVKDEALMNSIQDRINELYGQIIATSAYEEYKDATDNYELFYKDIQGEIDYQLTGKRPCAGDCSSCGGCH